MSKKDEDYEELEILLETVASKSGIKDLLQSTIEGLESCKGNKFRIKLKIVELKEMQE